MKNAIPKATDGNTPFHEYLHNIGGVHEDGYVMDSTGSNDVKSTDKGGKTMNYVENAPVRRVNIRNIQNILDRSSKGENPRLKIINNEK